MVSTLLSCSETGFGKLLSSAEIDTVDKVVSVIRNLNVSEIIAASHKEDGWQKYSPAHAFIPYDEAFDLKLVSKITLLHLRFNFGCHTTK